MKRLGLFLCLCGCTFSTGAAPTIAAKGFYLGGDLTFAVYQSPRGSTFANSVLLPVSGHIRPFIGYRFNDYFALEGGFSNLVNEKNNGGQSTTGLFGEPEVYGPDHYRLYDFDIETKWIYPMQYGFSVFGKLGAAYVHQDVYNQTYVSVPPSVNTNSNRLLPLVGIGTSFNFTKNIAAELSYTYLPGVSPIGRIAMLGIGLSYTLG